MSYLNQVLYMNIHPTGCDVDNIPLKIVRLNRPETLQLTTNY
jgi:hypothetical protein